MASSAEYHAQSQAALAQAEDAERRGEVARARELYGLAAEKEYFAWSLTDKTKTRTLGIVGVSVVSLLVRAGLYDEAEQRAYECLAAAPPEFAHHQLKRLLQDIWQEKVVAEADLKDSGEVLSIAVRGEGIGHGVAPMDLALEHIRGVQSLVYRSVEFIGHFPFRVRGLPPSEVVSACQPWVSEPIAGSYRFDVKLMGAGGQLALLPREDSSHDVLPEAVAGFVIQFIGAVSPFGYRPTPVSIEELVPDVSYRFALLRLTRNLVPDGKKVSTVEFVLTGRQPVMRSASLRPEAKEVIRSRLRTQSSQEVTENEPIVGILRALDLDRSWIEIMRESGESQRLRMPAGALDDVLGPLVNRRVSVSWRLMKKRIEVVDIEPLSDA